MMDRELDARLFSAALHVITDMWGDTMRTEQRASLANQIVREIERRKILPMPDYTLADRILNRQIKNAS